MTTGFARACACARRAVRSAAPVDTGGPCILPSQRRWTPVVTGGQTQHVRPPVTTGPTVHRRGAQNRGRPAPPVRVVPSRITSTTSSTLMCSASRRRANLITADRLASTRPDAERRPAISISSRNRSSTGPRCTVRLVSGTAAGFSCAGRAAGSDRAGGGCSRTAGPVAAARSARGAGSEPGRGRSIETCSVRGLCRGRGIDAARAVRRRRASVEPVETVSHDVLLREPGRLPDRGRERTQRLGRRPAGRAARPRARLST